MDIISIIAIVIAIVVAYLFIKLIVNPILRIVLDIIVFLVGIYLLQRYLGFDINKILAPFGVSINSQKWNFNISWIFAPVNYCINLVNNFLKHIWSNTPKP